MKKDMITIYLAFFCVLSTCSAFAQPAFRIVTGPFTPYTWCDGMKANKGIDFDILAELFKRAKRPYTVTCYPWKRALLMVEKGTADGIYPAFKTPERESFAVFLKIPLHQSQYRIFVRRGHEFPFETVGDLKEKTIGLDRGHSVSSAFDAGIKAKLFKIEEASPEKNIVRLLAGRVDAYVNNHLLVLHTAKQMGKLDSISSLPKPLTDGIPSYLMISKAAAVEGKQKLIERLNLIMQEMWDDGTVERLIELYIE